MVTIEKVASRSDLKRFAAFPNELYKQNECYIPSLVRDEMKNLDKDENASFEFCDADYFLAYKDGKVVGRVAAIYNPRAIETWQRNSVRFGWIDFIDDREVSPYCIGIGSKTSFIGFFSQDIARHAATAASKSLFIYYRYFYRY